MIIKSQLDNFWQGDEFIVIYKEIRSKLISIHIPDAKVNSTQAFIQIHRRSKLISRNIHYAFKTACLVADWRTTEVIKIPDRKTHLDFLRLNCFLRYLLVHLHTLVLPTAWLANETSVTQVVFSSFTGERPNE